MRKRILSIILSCFMVISMFPAQTFISMANTEAEPIGELYVNMNFKIETGATTFKASLVSKENAQVIKESSINVSANEKNASAFIQEIPDGTYNLEISAPKYVTYKQELTFDGRCIELDIYNNDSVNEGRKSDELFGVMPIGDVDGDGDIDDTDADKITSAIEAGTNNKSYDLNGDSIVDLADLSIAVRDEGKIVLANPVYKLSSKAMTVSLAQSGSVIANQTTVTGNVSKLLKSNNDESTSTGNEDSPVIQLENTDNTKKLNGTEENAVEMTLNVSNNLSSQPGMEAEQKSKATEADSLIITPPANSENTIKEGEVEVTYTNELNQDITILAKIGDNNANLQGIEANLMDATTEAAKGVTVENDGTVVINLGKRVAIKKVTIRVTKTANEGSLVEIAKVEFLSDFKERIPEPQLSIPTITNVSNTQSDGQGFKDLIVEWNPEQNVTGYEVKVSGPGYNKTASTSECKYTFKGDSFNGTVKSFNTYNVYVRSVSGDWRSDWSSVKEYTVVCNNKPATPEYVNVLEGVEHLKVSWTCKYDAESYTVYYKKESESTYKKIEGIKDPTTSCNINGLEPNVKYVVYVVAHNRIGSSGNSALAAGTPTTANGVSMPKYKLLNVDDKNNTALTHINSISGNNNKSYILYKSDGTNVNNGKASSEDWKVLLDNNPSSYLYIDDWDSGVYYENYRGPNITLDKKYKMNTICIAPFEGCSVHMNQVVIGYKDENSSIQKIGADFYTRYDSQNKRYYEIVFNEPVTTDYLEIRTTTGYSRNYTMSEVKLYYYDSLEDDVAALFKDSMRTTLKDNVTKEQINALMDRVNTVDSVSGEYHPHKKTIITDLEYALKLLNETANANLIDVDTNITATGNPNNGFAMALSDYQPLGHVAAAGDTVVVYVSDNTGKTARGNNVNLKLVATQFHPEVSNWQSSAIQLKGGRNEISIPKIGSYNKELGGSLYLQYTGAKGGAGYVVRITGATKIPYLNVDGITGSDRTTAITNYVNELGTYIGNLSESHTAHKYDGETNLNKNTDYAYSDTDCFLNSTEITLDNMMYSVPAKAVWAALGSGDNSSKAANLEKSIEAMEQEVDYFYQFKGLNKAATGNDAYPFTRLNIRYHKMFTGAFMYAGGKHIGIEYGSVGGLFGLNKITTDSNGKKTGGNLTGWGISHEIGHCINASAYQRVEVTNNMFAQLVATGNETNATGRWGSDYSAVYKAVATGTTGHTGNLAVQLAMYWQLHLAYDNDYIYKDYGLDIAAQQNGLFYARLESYLRDKNKAPKAFTATSGDQLFMQAACAAANKNILDFFIAWGIIPDQATKNYAAQYDKETRKIQYIDDNSRLYRIEGGNGMSSGTTVSASITNDSNSKINGNKVTISLNNNNTNSGAMLGYEIKRNGKMVAFVEADKTSYTDIVTTENNKAFTYTVVGIDRLLKETEVCTLPEVKVCHDGSINKDGWIATTNAVSSKDTAVEKHTDDPDSGYVNGSTKPSVEKNSAISAAIDNNPDTVYYGSAGGDGNRPYVILNLGGVEQVTALKFTPAKKDYSGDATSGSQPSASDLFKYRLFGYKIEVSTDGNNWTVVKQGNAYTGSAGNESSWVKQDDVIYNNDGSYTLYFCKADDPSLYTYDAAFVKVTATNMSAFAIAELDVLGPTNDNVDLFEVGYGTLKAEYNAGKYENDEDCIIPAGSVIFSGDYKGDPSYNVVLLKGTYENGETKVLDGSQLFFAEVPEKGKLGQTSDGRWIFWLEDKVKTDSESEQYNEFEQLTGLEKIQVELYRVQDALTLEGQRLTSTSLTLDLTEEGINKDITITDKLSNTDLGITTGKLFMPTEAMVETALNYSEPESIMMSEGYVNDMMTNLLAIGNTGAVLTEEQTTNDPEDENKDKTKNYVNFSYLSEGKYGFSFDAQSGIAAEVEFESEKGSEFDISMLNTTNTYINVKPDGNKKTVYVVAKSGNLGNGLLNGNISGVNQGDVIKVNELSLLDSTYVPLTLNLSNPVGKSDEASVKQAVIGGTPYESLIEAIENASPTDVIKLNTDVILNGDLDREVTIDLNGKAMVAQFNLNKVKFASDAFILEKNSTFIQDIITKFSGKSNVSVKEALEGMLQEDVAKVNGIVFSSFTDAVNAASDGDTIILVGNVSGNISTNKNLTIKTNGYTWYGTNSGTGSVVTDKNIAKNSDGKAFETINQAIDETGSGKTVTLLKNTVANITIPAYKSLTLDLNGNTLTGNITNNGVLMIEDSSFSASPFKLGTGKVTGEIVERNKGNLTFKSGKFASSQQNKGEKLLYKNSADSSKDSKSALINGEWVVMHDGMSLDFTLDYLVFEKDDSRPAGDYTAANAVKKNDISGEYELAANKDYTAVIYMNTSYGGAKIRSFNFTALYNNDIMTVKNRVNAQLSKYDKLDKSVAGVFDYELSTNNYTLAAGEYQNTIAAFDFVINADKITVDQLFNFTFGGTAKGDTAYVSTMDIINKIPLKFADKYTARITNQLNGVNIVDYAYAPKGYQLAVIAADHGNGYTATLDLYDGKLGKDVPVFFTDNPAYIAQSTNPEGKDITGTPNKLNGVYLALVDTSGDTPEGSSGDPGYKSKEQVSEERIAKAINNHKGKDYIIEPNMYTGAINNDGVVDYNDASIVYQMLKGNNKWGYDPLNTNLYIDSITRILCDGNRDGKLYGTIEDVNFILNLITDDETYSD